MDNFFRGEQHNTTQSTLMAAMYRADATKTLSTS